MVNNMTKKDVQNFDKLINKTFKGNENTFEMVIGILINMMVQENAASNQEFMEKIQKYIKSEQQINSFLTEYFAFSYKIIAILESLKSIQDELEYKQTFDTFVENLLILVPNNKLQNYIYKAMDHLFNVIAEEYNIESIVKLDEDSFREKLIVAFDGVVPMFELYSILGVLLVIDAENPKQIIDEDELYQQALILFSFVQFANIARMQIATRTEQRAAQPANQLNYKKKKTQRKIYQLKIAIKGIRPPIWRRVLVESDITFYELHEIIQSIFNWENYHLYQFDGHRCYTDEEAAQEAMGYKEEVDATKLKISQELKQEKDKIKYTYDFGDSWEHEVLLEKILKSDDSLNYPICTAGKRNGPIEDCGGILGYSELLSAIETKDFAEFYYKDFDPELFNKDEINKELEGLNIHHN